MVDITIDAILGKIDAAVERVQRAKGSKVLLPTAKLDLLVQLEYARDVMMSVLRTKDRHVLQTIFGGDCVRVSRIRAVLEFVELSDNIERSSRVSSVLDACISVERVLGDLGLGFTLTTARARQKQLLTEKDKGTLEDSPVVGEPRVSTNPSPQLQSAYSQQMGRQLSPPSRSSEPLPQLLTSSPQANTKRFEKPTEFDDCVPCVCEVAFPDDLEVHESAEHVESNDHLPVDERDYLPLDLIHTSPTVCSKANNSPEEASIALRNAVGCWAKDSGDPLRSTTSPSCSHVDDVQSDGDPKLAADWNSAQLTSETASPRTSLLSPDPSTVGLLDAPEDPQLGLASLDPALQRLVHRTFAFYTAADGTSIGSALSLSRFRCFLRDVGLLTSCVGADYGNGNVGSKHRRASLSCERTQVEASPHVPRLTSLSTAALLPLRICAAPPLSLVQAGLLYENSVAAARKDTMQSQMLMDAFVSAITQVALHCENIELWTMSKTNDEALKQFCEEVLVPLGQVLGLDGMELDVAMTLLARPDICGLMQRSRRGIEEVFARYSVAKCQPSPYTRGHWTSQAMKRFATDLDLVADLSHSSLQRLFDQIVQLEAEEGVGADGKMTFSAFQTCLVMIAQRLYKSSDSCPLHRMVLLLMRLSALKGAASLMPIARAMLTVYGPSLSQQSTKQKSGAQQRKVSSSRLERKRVSPSSRSG